MEIMDTLNDFVGSCLYLDFSNLTDTLEDEFDLDLSDKDVEYALKMCNGHPKAFGYNIFIAYFEQLKDKLSEDYDDFNEDKLDFDFDGCLSSVSYNGHEFKTRDKFEKILKRSYKN